MMYPIGDHVYLWVSIVAFLVFSLGSGVLAGYIAGRWEDLGRYAFSICTLGLGTFFLLFLAYTMYLKVYARMPIAWTGTLVWGHYPALIAAVTFGWKVGRSRNSPPKLLR